LSDPIVFIAFQAIGGTRPNTVMIKSKTNTSVTRYTYSSLQRMCINESKEFTDEYRNKAHLVDIIG
jgi:hypothetical protein